MFIKSAVYTIAFFLSAITLCAQNNTHPLLGKEFSFTTENDAYLFQKKDAYYTNGLFFLLSKASEKNGNKQISSFQIGQMIYTPLSKKATAETDIDRPYCGLLFAKYARTRFFSDGSLLQFNGGISELGPASGGEGLQNSYHTLLGYTKFNGWKYQIPDAFGVDFGVMYAQTLLQDTGWIKMVPQITANAGTTFINAGFGVYTVMGCFEKNSQSALWNARSASALDKPGKNFELFLYWYPQVLWQGYNGTIEGGLFSNGKGAVLGTTKNFMFQQALGICFADGKWATRIAWVHQSREAVNQINPQDYGSVTVSYRFH